MRKLVSAVAYYVLCILMSPLILIGYIVWVGKTIATGRSGVSGTAQGPLTARFSEHHFGTRQDEAADRLIRLLPGLSLSDQRTLGEDTQTRRAWGGFATATVERSS